MEYRIVTYPEVEFGELSAPLVAIDGWAHSVWTEYPAPGTITQFVRRIDRDGTEIDTHPVLHRRQYRHPVPGSGDPSATDQAKKAAFEAGILGYFVRGGE